MPKSLPFRLCHVNTDSGIYCTGNGLDHERMDASSARSARIRQLVAEAGGPAEFARRYGGANWTQAQVSQWISITKPKGIGHKLAREIESRVGLPAGWMDHADGITAFPSSQSVSEQRAMIAAVVRLTDYLNDMAVEPIPPERRMAVIEAAIEVVQGVGVDRVMDGTGLPEAARQVAASMRGK